MLTKGLLLAVDANSLLHRAYHAYPSSLVTTDGQPINAVYGFTSMFIDALLMFKPEYVFCAFDTAKPTFRHRQYAGYKANRPKKDNELIVQIPSVYEIVRTMNIPLLTLEGYEADDILGTIAHKLISERNPDIKHIHILTGDKDLFQLVNEKVQVIMPKGSFKNLEVYSDAKVMEKMGVTPSQVIELKGLMGDPSDNIPGVRGVGIKTATNLLTEYRSIENIYKNIDGINEKSKRTAKLLIEGHEEAIMSRSLATIVTNAPIGLTLKEAKTKRFDAKKVSELFARFQFKSLYPRYKKLLDLTGNTILGEDSTPIQKETTSFDTKEYFEEKSSNVLIEEIEVEEFSFFERVDFIENLSVKNEHTLLIYQDGKLIKISNFLRKDFFKEHLITFGAFRFLNDALSVGVGGVADAATLTKVLDIELISYAMQTGKREYTLKSDYVEAGFPEYANLHREKKDVFLSIIRNRIVSEIERVGKYEELPRVKDVWASQEEMKNPTPVQIAMKEDMLAGIGIALMHHRGITINLKQVRKTVIEFRTKVSLLEKEIHDIVGFEFNVRSPKQLGEVLFGNLNLPHGKKTKSGYSTNESVLHSLVDAHPAVRKILEFRKLSKLVSTYMEPYLELAGEPQNLEQEDQMSLFGASPVIPEDDKPEFYRVHSDFSIMGTSSGRLSSRNPNLQNLPAKTEIGRQVRRFFIPSKGKKLVSIDYSQIDLRVLAHITGDVALVKAFNNNQDIHQNTAAKVFGVPFEKVTTKQRKFAKTINFGLIYGMSSYGLSQSLEIPVDEAQRFIDDYFKKFPGVQKYMAETILFAKEYGYVVSLFGRRRYVRGIDSNIRARAKGSERESINMPIQGGADDIMRLALNKLTVLPEILSGECPIVLQVHDEFVFELKDDEDYIKRKIAKFTDIMENIVDLKVPLKVDAAIGEDLDL